MTTPTTTTKDKILTTAIDLFSRNGFSGVSIRDITREVGIKESSLYNHFRNKDDILETIFTIFRTEYAKALPPLDRLDDILAQTDTAAFLHRGYENYKLNVGNPLMGKIWRILQIEQYRDPRAQEIMLQDIIYSTLDFLEAVFTKLIALGRIKPLNPRVLAAEYQYPVFAMMTEYNILKFNDRDTAQIEQRMAEHIEFFLTAIQENQ